MAAILPSVTALGVENVEASKLDNDSSSQIEQEELEVNLHIEGSGKRGLKRRASLSWGEGSCDSPSRKRPKDEHVGQEKAKDPPPNAPADAIDRPTLIDDLTQELECGCCAALVYNPVTILPCQHSFCGR
jgi:E3 ubiquitin-protein ligase CHFR